MPLLPAEKTGAAIIPADRGNSDHSFPDMAGHGILGKNQN